MQRLAAALHRDGAKVLATDEDRGLSTLGSVRPLSELWVERDRVAHELEAVVPPGRADALSVVSDAAEDARSRAAEATQFRVSAEEQAAAMRGLFRRTEIARAQRELQRAVDYEQWRVAEAHELEDERAALAEHQQERAAVLDAHRDELDQLHDLDRAIATRAHLAGRAAEIERPARIVDVLGDPPTGLTEREQWREAAAAIESYAARWGVDPADEADHVVDATEQFVHLEDVQRRIRDVTDSTDLTEDITELGLW